MTGHTKGPWSTQETGDGYHGLRVVGPGGGELCRASKANAHLIAAAPDLLAACEEALACFACDGHSLDAIAQIRAAIDKAKGD